MANGSFDAVLRREVELYGRVDSNDPANSALILVVLTHTGLEADSVLRTYANLSALLAASNNEATNSVRKTLTDADLAAYTVDTTNHRIVLPLANQTYTTPAAGDNWSKLLICYDSDTTSGTDTDIVPMVHMDIIKDGVPVVPNGNDIIFSFADGFLVAT